MDQTFIKGRVIFVIAAHDASSAGWVINSFHSFPWCYTPKIPTEHLFFNWRDWFCCKCWINLLQLEGNKPHGSEYLWVSLILRLWSRLTKIFWNEFLRVPFIGTTQHMNIFGQICSNINDWDVNMFCASCFLSVSRKVRSSPPTKCPAECSACRSLRTTATLSPQERDTSSSGTWTPQENDGYHPDL